MTKYLVGVIQNMRTKVKRLIFACVMVVMLLSLALPSFAALNDVSGHWAEPEVNKWVDKGIIKGYEDATFRPDNTITRAEFTALIARIFNFVKKADTVFPDVDADAWFAETVSKSVAAGIIKGDDTGNFRPYDPITRQEAAVILYRVFDLKVQNEKAADAFADSSSIPGWSKDAISSLFENGYIKGRPDNTFAPTDNLNRAEAVKMIDSIAGNLINVEGTYTGNFDGNLVVNTDGITLKDMSIAGDLFLAHGIGEGNVTLSNVNIDGRVVVRGGGENSIILDNTSITGTLLVIKKDGKVRIVVRGDSEVPYIQVSSSSIIAEEDVTGQGVGNVEVIELEPGETLVLDGDFEAVDVIAPGVTVNVEGGKVGKVNITESAVDSKVNIASATVEELNVAAKSEVNIGEDASLTNLNADASVNVAGKGTIENANINADDVVIEQKPANVTVAEGIKAEVGGEVIEGKPEEEETPVPIITPPPAPTVNVNAIKLSYKLPGTDEWVWTDSATHGGTITTLANLADTVQVRDIRIETTPSTGTMKLTSLVDSAGAGLIIPDILAVEKNLPTASIEELAGDFLSGGDGVSLKNLRAAFGGSVKVTGIINASNGAQQTVTFTINLKPDPSETPVNQWVNITEDTVNRIIYAEIKEGKADTRLRDIRVYQILSQSNNVPYSVIIDGTEYICAQVSSSVIADAISGGEWGTETLGYLKDYLADKTVQVVRSYGDEPYTLQFR